MIGIPGQSYDDLADDIELFGRLDLDMIGVGPYLRHPDTPLGEQQYRRRGSRGRPSAGRRIDDLQSNCLGRLTCPRANIPATTALATLNRHEGRELGLVRGANVVMPNLTPPEYRALYEIYPHKACLAETGEECHDCLTRDRVPGPAARPGPGRFAELHEKTVPSPMGAGQGVGLADSPSGCQIPSLPTALTLALYPKGKGTNTMSDRNQDSAAAGWTSSTRSDCRACWNGRPMPARCRRLSPRACRKSPFRWPRPPCCWRPTSRGWWKQIFDAARQLKREVYGNRIVLFAPCTWATIARTTAFIVPSAARTAGRFAAPWTQTKCGGRCWPWRTRGTSG